MVDSHAILPEKKKTTVKVVCPKCSSAYWISATELPEHERCPMCGFFDRLEVFRSEQDNLG